MATYHESFIKDLAHATRLATEVTEELWSVMQDSRGPKQVRLRSPPWLQGMKVMAEAQPVTRPDGREEYSVTAAVVSSPVNPAFEPVRAMVRVRERTCENFCEIVQPLVLAMIQEADQRVPAQLLANMIHGAGMKNHSHPLAAAFRHDFARKCGEIGVRPAFGTMPPDSANDLLIWFRDWAGQRGLTVPEVWFDRGWASGITTLTTGGDSTMTLAQELAAVPDDLFDI